MLHLAASADSHLPVRRPDCSQPAQTRTGCSSAKAADTGTQAGITPSRSSDSDSVTRLEEGVVRTPAREMAPVLPSRRHIAVHSTLTRWTRAHNPASQNHEIEAEGAGGRTLTAPVSPRRRRVRVAVLRPHPRRVAVVPDCGPGLEPQRVPLPDEPRRAHHDADHGPGSTLRWTRILEAPPRPLTDARRTRGPASVARAETADSDTSLR